MAVFWRSKKEKKNKLGIPFQSMKYCCRCCKYCQDETKNSCTDFFFLLSLRVLERGEWLKKEKKGDFTHSPTGLISTLLKYPQRSGVFFLVYLFPPSLCHAFNGKRFPIGSALEVAPAFISLIFRTERCIRRAVG